MMIFNRFSFQRPLLVMILCCLGTVSFGQANMLEAEQILTQRAKILLEGNNFDQQIAENKLFSRELIETLRQPESFLYPFDSLKSISILTAEDHSFRIFTWQIVRRPDNKTYYGEVAHYYFGLIQRNLPAAENPEELIIIPLVEQEDIPRGVETEVLDNYNWLGALYYPFKGYGTKIPLIQFKYYDPRQIGSNGKIKRIKQDHYVLLGWNGMDNTSNLKSVEVISFDPKKPNRALFGAPIFFFDPVVPKSRALFRYSEYAPFGLNYGYAKGGLFGLGKEKVILYDHLATPGTNGKQLTEIWDMGPDGSYDALALRNGRFEWFKNVEVISTLSKGQADESVENQERILRARLAEAKRMAQLMDETEIVAEIEALEAKDKLTNRTLKKLRQNEKLILKKQNELQAAERQRLKEAGIELGDKESNR